MYFTSGSNRAFEQLMQGKPGFDHYDSGEAVTPEDCGTCRFYRPHWKYQFCVYAECPYQPGKLTAYDAVTFRVKGVENMAVFRVERNKGYTVKTIAFSIKSAKLTIQVLQAAARKFLETQNKGKTKLHHGQQSLKQLKKHGAALSNIEITDANIGLFKPCAKKYGVDFTLRKDATTQPPHYIVIFKAKDADNMEQAFKEFTAKKLQREERPSIRKDIAASKEKAAARNADRAKEKFKERGLSR